MRVTKLKTQIRINNRGLDKFMKKGVLLFLFMFYSHFLFFGISKNQEMTYLDHFSTKELNKIILEKNYTKEFIISMGNKEVIIFGNNLKKNPDCIITLYENDVLLDSLYVMYFYNSANGESYYDENVFCVECLSKSDPIIFLVFCSSELTKFEIIPINTKGLWGLCADLNNIFYSIEYDNKPIKRFSIKNKSLYEYNYKNPGGVNIFNMKNRFFFNISSQGKTVSYELLENDIKQVSEVLAETKKKKIIIP